MVIRANLVRTAFMLPPLHRLGLTETTIGCKGCTPQSESSERNLPSVKLADMQTADDVAKAMAGHFNSDTTKYTLSEETKALLNTKLQEAEIENLATAWTSRNPVDRTMFWKKGNTRIIDKIVGGIHEGSYNGRYISVLLDWEKESKITKTNDVKDFIRRMSTTQHVLMAIAVYITTGEVMMAAFVKGLQSAKRSRSPGVPEGPGECERSEGNTSQAGPSVDSEDGAGGAGAGGGGDGAEGANTEFESEEERRRRIIAEADTPVESEEEGDV